MRLAALLLTAFAFLAAVPQPPVPDAFAQDFDVAWRKVASTYAYFDVKATRWDAIPQLYRDDLTRVSSKRDFVTLLERVMDELYDPHAQLTVNTATSPRLVPSGTDLWAEWRDGEATIVDVRSGSDAERAGIRPGSRVRSIDHAPIADAVDKRLGRSYPHSVAAARDWALRAVLAGVHNATRTLELKESSATRTVELPGPDQYQASALPPIITSRLPSGVGRIAINDSLGDIATVAAFDRALDELKDAPALLLDLRNTPSGGNTSVARGILGRFVEREMPYQKHVLPSEEAETGIRRSWLELVSPRAPFAGQRPVAVLVGHWTGSMGEGLAIGFDAIGRAIVVGTPMAGLLGATYHVMLPNSGIGINVPAERLYHVNGTPREAFHPGVIVDVMSAAPGADAVVAAALRALTK
jgi:carboxyl-terminal processing protease